MKLNKHKTIVLAIIIIISIVVVISWFVFPEWKEIPGGQFILITIAAPGVLSLIKLVIDIIQALNENPKQIIQVINSPFVMSEPHLNEMPIHNLPQREGEFIGRNEDIKKIFSLLKKYPDSQIHIIAIDGIGGVGKSSLALEIALKYLYERNFDNTPLPNDERFDAIIWTSAKRTTLSDDSIEPIRGSIAKLSDIFNKISLTLQRNDILMGNQSDIEDKVRLALCNQRTLLIVDNLETLDDNELIKVMSFLREVPAPTKVILTSRKHLNVAYINSLDGLNLEDSRSLVINECNKKKLQLNKLEVDEISKKTSGIPLAIVWSVAQIGKGKNFWDVIKNLPNKDEDLARFCFEEIYNQIMDKPAYKILLALSLFEKDANENALKNITQLNIDDFREGIETLRDYSMISFYNDRYSMLPITKDFVSQSLEKNLLRKVFTKRWLKWLDNFGKDYGQDIFFKSDFRAILNNEYENFLAAIKWCVVEHRWKICIDLFNGIYYFLLVSNYYDILEEIISSMIIAQREIGHKNANTLFQIGYFYFYRGTSYYEQAMPFLYQAKLVAETNLDLLVLARVLDCLSLICSRRGEREKAVSYSQELTNLVNKIQDPYVEYLANFRTAKLCKTSREQSDYLEKAKNIAERMGWERWIAWLDFYEAEAAVTQKSLQNAEHLFVISRNKAINLGEQTLIILCDARLASDIYPYTNRQKLLTDMAPALIDRCQRLDIPSYYSNRLQQEWDKTKIAINN